MLSEGSLRSLASSGEGRGVRSLSASQAEPTKPESFGEFVGWAEVSEEVLAIGSGASTTQLAEDDRDMLRRTLLTAREMAVVDAREMLVEDRERLELELDRCGSCDGRALEALCPIAENEI